MIATSAAISDWLFVSSIVPMQPGDEDYAISVAVPLNAGGCGSIRADHMPRRNEHVRLSTVIQVR